MKTQNFNFLDKERNRYVPMAIYFDEKLRHIEKVPVIFLNHGSSAPTIHYTYLTNFLAKHGYAVICIQHDLIGDELISTPKFQTGNIAEARKPIWECWTANMLIAIKELKRIYPHFNFEKFSIIGHSTGGDVAMFFTNRYKKMVKEIISFDGRRCPFPREASCRILFFEANDTTVDDGIIPIGNHNITIEKPKIALHSSYSDRGPDTLKKEVLAIIGKFLGLK